MRPDAVIFDMDGTMINNNHYHFLAWQSFYQKNNRTISLDEYKTNISGRTSMHIFEYFFGKPVTREEITPYANEKNQLYRLLYAPHIKPVDGLVNLLQHLKDADIPLGVATSGMPANVRFMFDNVPIEHYFSHVVDASQITHSKPDPEIFLKAARSANADPVKCIAFEDSIAGIAAAKAARMKVIGITTMETREVLQQYADAVIDDFTGVNLTMLESLMT